MFNSQKTGNNEIIFLLLNIISIIRGGELEKEATVSNMEIVRLEGSRKVKRVIDIYNLDMILSVGNSLVLLLILC